MAIFGAIIVGGSGRWAGRRASRTWARRRPAAAPISPTVFSYVFGAALVGFGLSLVFLLAMEERPLRGTAVKAAEAAIAD